MIPYSHQSVNQDDIDAVVAVLRGDWLTQGPEVEAFEEALAESVGARYAVAFANGTAALHGAVVAAGIGPGDMVATSPLSFVASANCARYAGAAVQFVDIDRATLNLDPSRVPSTIDALIPVHFGGLPVDLAALPQRPRVIIEDAAHALGASTPDGPVGNCARSDMCVFSFHPVKSITTGEGGTVTTNDERLASELRRFRSHGMLRRPENGGWAYEISTLGFNYRLTDMQAALGRSQLGRLGEFVARRQSLADRYFKKLAGLPIVLPPLAPPGFQSGLHLFPIQVSNRRAVYDGMRSAGIGVQVHYIPIYSQPLYADAASVADFPNTEAVAGSLLSLPLFPDLSSADQDTVISTLESLL